MACIRIEKQMTDAFGNAVRRRRQCNAADFDYFESQGYVKAEMTAAEKKKEDENAKAIIEEAKRISDLKATEAKLRDLNKQPLSVNKQRK